MTKRSMVTILWKSNTQIGRPSKIRLFFNCWKYYYYRKDFDNVILLDMRLNLNYQELHSGVLGKK
jgi:hypothetical protein